jgi:hypothetical protein
MSNHRYNKPRGRCYEGIPIDKKVPKTHLDDHDWKMYYQHLNLEIMIRLFGTDWCMRHGML